MSARNTPNLKNFKSNYSSAAKCSTPTNTTPVKPARSTLSLSKTASSLPRVGFVKQQSACDLRERYNWNNVDTLNTAFSSVTPLARLKKDSAKNKLTTSNSSLGGSTSKLMKKSLEDGMKSGLPSSAKCLFGSFTSKLQESNNRTPECFSKVSFDPYTPQSNKKSTETPRKSHKQSSDAKPKENSEVSNLTVAVRIRPMNVKECTTPSAKNVVKVDGNQVIVSGREFDFDHVFPSHDSDDTENFANQEKVFNGIALPLIDRAFEGYNVCLFAYGQTGSGKSYSMMGIDSDDDNKKPNSEAGIIPRFCYELFRRIRAMKDKYSAQVEVSYFEIYNEKIHDLLAVTPTHIPSLLVGNQDKKPALKVRDHKDWGPYVEDLNTHPVDSSAALKNWLAVGNSQRATAATGMNNKSSRSHSIFTITLTLSEISGEFLTKRSRISMVDLAGSERQSQTCVSDERLKEGVSINQSLLALSKVITALAESKRNANDFIPYRDSLLTRLLKENLGGNSKTVMLATISPASQHVEETLATLRYARKAGTIVNRVKVNEDRNDREIQSLRVEVDNLRAQVQYYKRQEIHAVEAAPRKIIIETVDANNDGEVEKEKLRQQLREKEQELAKAQNVWLERIREADNKCQNEMKLLQQNGLALQLSVAQKQPCLINLANDPMLSGTLLYILPPGIVRIGRPKPSTHAQSDIVLDGPLVGLNHCEIDNRRGKLFIRPSNNDCETFVNGELIHEERQIYHGDRVVIGGLHYFRVSNPQCSRQATTDIIDFQTAHQEILKEQEKRLRSELLAENEAALQQMEEDRVKHQISFNEKVAKLELEKFRYQCSKELVEAEKAALARNRLEESLFEYQPFESNLGEKIRQIMERPSEEGLHEIQLKVKEATQRCRDLGLNYEFIQTQVIDEFGLFKAIVKIIDKKLNRYAEWPTARLSVWLDLIRDNFDINAENVFHSIDIVWTDLPDNPDLNESLNSSKISLNLSAIKEAIFGTFTRNNKKNASNNLHTRMVKNNLSHMNSPTDAMPKQQSKTEPFNKYDNKTDERSNSNLMEKFNSLGEGLSTSTPTQDSLFVEMQHRLRNVRKELAAMRKLCKKETDQNKDTHMQTVASNILKVLDDIDPLTTEIRSIVKGTENATTPCKTAKSVRFIID